nr:2Fe-2S iron-sulfur cluster binding domain-containing protein [Candidatus Bathyarchaeota archaeon]
MEAAQALGVDISTLCAGKGTCGKCKIRVMGEATTRLERTESEMKHLSEDEVQAGIRLACLTRLGESTVIYVPLRSRVGSQRLQTEGLD